MKRKRARRMERIKWKRFARYVAAWRQPRATRARRLARRIRNRITGAGS